MFDKKLPECKKCPYFLHIFVPSEGNLQADVVFVADSPWRSEAKAHRPLVGPAGQIYNMLLEEVGIDRREVFTSNAVHCVPDALGAAYPEGVVELCTELFLKPELEKINPKLVIPMGNNALKAMGGGVSITKARGFVKDLEFKGSTYKILPSFHPSFILRKPAYLEYAVKDFQAIKYYLDNEQERPQNKDLNYKAVTTIDQVAAFFEEFEKAKYIAVDTETTGLDYRTDDILSMQFSFAPKTGYCLPMYVLPFAENAHKSLVSGILRGKKLFSVFNTRTLLKIYELLHRKDKAFFFHNGKFDLRMLNAFFLRNIKKAINIDSIRWYDTMAMHGLFDENTWHTLKEICKIYTDLRYTSEELSVVKGGQMKKAPLDRMVAYSVKDSDATRRIAFKFAKELRNQGLWNIYAVHEASDMKIANILYKMEIFGAPIDHKEIVNLEFFMSTKLKYYQERMETIVGYEFNPNSDLQLRKVLFEDLDFPVPEKKTKGGKISTDKEVISELIEKYPENKFLENFRMHRNYTSIEETFVRGLQNKLGDDGRLHPDFGFTRTVSGRIVCYKPNLANIPREKEFEEGIFVSIRKLFAAAPNKKIVYADAMQIEFKVAAILSGDKKLIKALFEDREDFHNLVARALYPQYEDTLRKLHDAEEKLKNKIDSRKLREKYEDIIASCIIILKTGRTRSKNFNFGRIYGAQLPTLATSLGTTVEKIEPFIARLQKRYPVFEEYLIENPRQAIRDGFLVNPFGRKRRFPPTLDERVVEEQARQAGNFSSQSSAAYAIRAALYRIAVAFERVGMESYPFDCVYDSIITESPDDEVQDAIEIMGQEMLAPVPELNNHVFGIELGVGQNWQEAEKNAVKIYTMADLKTVEFAVSK